MRGHIVRRLAIALAALLVAATPAQAAKLSTAERPAPQRHTADTWHSFDLMVDARTGAPADNVSAGGQRSGYTSPTNIGAYLWSTVGARETGLITRKEAAKRAGRTLRTLAGLERGPGATVCRSSSRRLSSSACGRCWRWSSSARAGRRHRGRSPPTLLALRRQGTEGNEPGQRRHRTLTTPELRWFGAISAPLVAAQRPPNRPS